MADGWIIYIYNYISHKWFPCICLKKVLLEQWLVSAKIILFILLQDNELLISLVRRNRGFTSQVQFVWPRNFTSALPSCAPVPLFYSTQTVFCSRDLWSFLCVWTLIISRYALSQLSLAHSTLPATVTSKWCSIPAPFWLRQLTLHGSASLLNKMLSMELYCNENMAKSGCSCPKLHLSLHCTPKQLVWRMQWFHVALRQRWCLANEQSPFIFPSLWL